MILNKYKHFSFDLDGTLVYTTSDYRHRIVPKVIKELGGKIKEKHSIDRFWFESSRDEIIQNDFNIEPATFWSLFRKLDKPENRTLSTFVFNDVESCFKKLRKFNKVLSIITGAPEKIAKFETKKFNGVPYDLFLSIYDSDYNEKPDPVSFHFVLEKLAIDSKDTVYIGNSNEDAYFAKNANVDFIYIDRGEHKFELKKHAVKIIQSLDELFV